MKIAVYGDSFADTRNIFRPENDYSWVTCLKNKGYDVTNYGKAASSLFYSYKNFIETNQDYDKIIFLLTGRGRFDVQGLPDNDGFVTFGMLNSLISRENYTTTQREIANACVTYYKYVYDDLKENVFHELLIKELRNTRPDALYIPCFPHCFKGQEETDIIDLDHFSLFDHKHFNISPTGPDDRRYCHMNEGNNQMLADKIDEWIQTNRFILTRNDAVNPINTPEYYFTMNV